MATIVSFWQLIAQATILVAISIGIRVARRAVRSIGIMANAPGYRSAVSGIAAIVLLAVLATTPRVFAEQVPGEPCGPGLACSIPKNCYPGPAGQSYCIVEEANWAFPGSTGAAFGEIYYHERMQTLNFCRQGSGLAWKPAPPRTDFKLYKDRPGFINQNTFYIEDYFDTTIDSSQIRLSCHRVHLRLSGWTRLRTISMELPGHCRGLPPELCHQGLGRPRVGLAGSRLHPSLGGRGPSTCASAWSAP